MAVDTVGVPVRIAPRALLRRLLMIVAFFGVMGVIAAIVTHSPSLQGAFPGDTILQQQFYLDNELSIPTWFSSMLLFASATIAAATAFFDRRSRSVRLRWLGLGIILTLMSIDEVAVIHENFSTITRNALGVGGVFYFAWVIPGMAFAAIVGLAYLRFVLALPPRIRTLIIVAAAIYLSGAVGVELIGGAIAESQGETSLVYGFVTTVEELLEMIGLSLLIYTLLSYFSSVVPASLRIDADG